MKIAKPKINRDLAKSFFAFIRKRAKKDLLLYPSLFILAIFFSLVLFAPYIAPYPYDKIDLSNRLAPVGTPGFPLGKDNLGRDILSRLIYGTQVVFRVIFLASIIGAGFGILLGLIAGYKGGIIDTLISRAVDILLAFPTLLLALAVVVVLGRGLDNAIVAVSIPAIAKFARVVRAQTLSVKESSFVEISKMMGGGTLHILREHVFTNILAATLVQVIINISTSILAVSSLGFLGLGVEPPQPEWGAMINENRAYLREGPHAVILPGVAIFLIILAWNSVGQAMTEYFQPRWKKQ